MDAVAVYPGQYVRAWHLDGHRDSQGVARTWDYAQRPGSAGNTANVRPCGTVVRWRDACATPWRTWAMLAPYVLCTADGEALRRQPRVAKDVYGLLRERGFVLAFPAIILEGDNPGKSAWTPDLLDAWMAQLAASPLLDGALVWPTPHGFRVVYLLDRPLYDPSDYEARWRALVAAHAREGLVLDAQTCDWTRFNAPPKHTRPTEAGGRELVNKHWSASLALQHARRWSLGELPDPAAHAVAARATRPGSRARVTVAANQTFVRLDAPADAGDAWEPYVVVFAVACPPVWAPRVRTLAAAMLEVGTEWHSPFLALAGALCERGVAEELVPAIVGAVSEATGNDARTGDRVSSAVSTVGRWLALRAGSEAALPIMGRDALVLRWPGLADALDEATDGPGPQRLERLCGRPAPALPDRADVAALVAASIEDALRGVTIVVTNCGLGKTRSAVEIAARAASVAPDAPRAPDGSKTAIALPTNEKAEEVYSDLIALGVPARRIYSPLAHRENGAPSCIHVEAGRLLAAGGQSVRREFCDGRDLEPCERRAVCPAYAGAEGAQRARVLVGTHALLDELADHAGPTGRLIIDESPPAVVAERFTADDIARVAEFRFAFRAAFVDACLPLVVTLRAGLVAEGVVALRPFAELVADWSARLEPELVRRACEAADMGFASDGDLVAQAIRAAAGACGDGPPRPGLLPASAIRARRQGGFAASVGTVSRVLRAVHRAAASALRGDGAGAHAARVERGRDGGAVLVLTGPNEPLARALNRDGVTIVTDATPDVHAYSLLCGADLEAQGRVHRHHAGAGADVSRTLLYWRDGSRNWLFRRDGVHATPLRSAVRATVRWALETPAATRLGIVTFARAELVLAHALARATPAAAAVRAAWLAQGLDAANLDECTDAVAPLLAEFLTAPVPEGAPSRRILLAHYGAIRGLNRMEREGVTALATLGDPRGELDEARAEASYLGVDDWQERYEQQARDHLAQAQGRLRVIWRSGKLVALHAGTVLPSDPLWAGGVSFRRIPAHRPKADAAMQPDALRAVLAAAKLTTLRSGAARLGIGKSALANYLNGDKAIPADVADRAAGLSGPGAGCPRNPIDEEGRDFLQWGSVDSEPPIAVQLGGKTWTPDEADGWLQAVSEEPPEGVE